MSESAPTSAPPSTRRDIGSILGDRYVIVQLIGEGGQAQVYRAVDTQGGPDVAVKVLHRNISRDPGFCERFWRESRILRDLKSPATLRVHGEFLMHDERLALATEFLRGETLGDRLRGLQDRGARMPFREIVEIMRGVSEALEEAHLKKVVHRDLKPDNLFLLNEERDGTRVKVLDFGFAKFLNLGHLTAAKMVAGSPRYIAPEAWLGESNLTAAFDVYSLGAVVFHCLVGHPPFPEGDLLKLFTQVTKEKRPVITKLRPDVPRRMNGWMKKSLAIKPGDRWRSVREQFVALEKALT